MASVYAGLVPRDPAARIAATERASAAVETCFDIATELLKTARDQSQERLAEVRALLGDQRPAIIDAEFIEDGPDAT